MAVKFFMSDINRKPDVIGDRKTEFAGGPGGPTGSDAADRARRMRAVDPEDGRPLRMKPGQRLA